MGGLFSVSPSFIYALLILMYALLILNSKDREVQNVVEKCHVACWFFRDINGVGKADEELRVRQSLG